ncbi:diphthamide synthesis protein [Sarocladium implicatum]|nr:diphthamide synthesis protein [Sarocladium implicatum]
MSDSLAAPPVLSTPDDHILDLPAATDVLPTTSTLSDLDLRTTYDIPRTVTELRVGGWQNVALQFPDHMLVDAPRVADSLAADLAISSDDNGTNADDKVALSAPRISILADTSYSACCVDEIAAEHADAQVVVHYGRTCLSPTSRIPAIYVYTSHALDHDVVLQQFEAEFSEKAAKIVVMADLTYQSHVADITAQIQSKGYTNVVATEVIRDPAAVIPNRKTTDITLNEDTLKDYAIFHISDPPTALLLALQARCSSLHVLSTPSAASPKLNNPTLRTAGLLRRRFARVLSLASAGVIGILVNTLSVSNYMTSIDLLRKKIAAAGKKSYTVVVGKLNPAKLANFAEVEGWVVVGCWESGLTEDDAGYWRPVVTPFEMEVALLSEEERTWGGEWWGGIERLTLDDGETLRDSTQPVDPIPDPIEALKEEAAQHEEDVDGEESLPPEYDLRTGKLVSHSRPMRLVSRPAASTETPPPISDADSTNERPPSAAALIKRTVGELASINGVASPGAEYLRSQRTWQGLGSDFSQSQEMSTVVEEGRSGVARGYQVGEDGSRH